MKHDWRSPPPDVSTLGELIRRRRLELGLTQEQLAEMISSDDELIRQSDVSNLERGRVRLPRRERMERIAVALQLTLGELLARSGWAEADHYLVAALLGVPHSGAGETERGSREVERIPDNGDRTRWLHDAEAARIVRARLVPGAIDTVLGSYRSAALWMATAEDGFRGFLLLTDRAADEIVSIGFWDDDQAMRNSQASLYLPLQSLRFQHMLAEPVSIDHFSVAVWIGNTPERHEGRLSQLDRARIDPGRMGGTVEQFHELSDRASGDGLHLDRSILLMNAAAGRATAVGIWREGAAQPPQQRPRESPSPQFPQLIEPSTSHHYHVELEV